MAPLVPWNWWPRDSLASPNKPDVDDDGDAYTEIQGDCDDTDPAVNPGATEVPYNGKDDDCNGLTDYIFNLPDSGQTISYTGTFGEDADYIINPPSYFDNGDGTSLTDKQKDQALPWQLPA